MGYTIDFDNGEYMQPANISNAENIYSYSKEVSSATVIVVRNGSEFKSILNGIQSTNLPLIMSR